MKDNCWSDVPEGPPNGHVWRLDEDGTVDVFFVDCGFHNGPGCIACGESFCEHCDPDCWHQECSGVIEGKVVPVHRGNDGASGDDGKTDSEAMP